MSKLPRGMSVREVVKALERAGFYIKRQKESHIVLRRDSSKAMELNKTYFDRKREEYDRLREYCKKHNTPEAEVDRLIERLKSYKQPPVRGEVVKCSKCGRQILFEQLLIGVDPTAETIATCWECLDDKARERTKKLNHTVRGELGKCGKCGRKLLIEQCLIGIDHTLKIISVVCWGCLDDKSKERAKEFYHIKVE